MKPLVSCICITQNRRLFLHQAIQYFFRAQHFCQLDCELIILDGSAQLNEEVATDAASEWDDVHYFHLPTTAHTRMGEFHNRACQLSRGEIIMKWDDDDWYAADRIDKQVKNLKDYRSNGMALLFTSQYYGYHLAEKKAFRSRCWNVSLSGTMGGILAFHRTVWEQVPFQDVEQGEDAVFFEDCKKAEITMLDSVDPSLYVYIRHNQNASAHSNNLFEDHTTITVRNLLQEDIDFYDELSEILPLSQRALPTTFGQHGAYSAHGRLRLPYGIPPQNQMRCAICEQGDMIYIPHSIENCPRKGLPQPNVPLGNNPFKR